MDRQNLRLLRRVLPRLFPISAGIAAFGFVGYLISERTGWASDMLFTLIFWAGVTLLIASQITLGIVIAAQFIRRFITGRE